MEQLVLGTQDGFVQVGREGFDGLACCRDGGLHQTEQSRWRGTKVQVKIVSVRQEHRPLGGIERIVKIGQAHGNAAADDTGKLARKEKMRRCDDLAETIRFAGFNGLLLLCFHEPHGVVVVVVAGDVGDARMPGAAEYIAQHGQEGRGSQERLFKLLETQVKNIAKQDDMVNAIQLFAQQIAEERIAEQVIAVCGAKVQVRKDSGRQTFPPRGWPDGKAADFLMDCWGDNNAQRSVYCCLVQYTRSVPIRASLLLYESFSKKRAEFAPHFFRRSCNDIVGSSQRW
jgi:hypothetical protein